MAKRGAIMKLCKKCDYEWTDVYLDDAGDEYVPSHYCYDDTYYDCETEEWVDDELNNEEIS